MRQGRIITAICLVLFALGGTCATKISVGNGDWSTNGTWSPSGVPACGDSIIIQPNHTVIISSNLSYNCAAMVVVVRGTLTFGNGDKLKLPCGSKIYVFTGGQITGGGGGGSSNTLDVCGTTFWESSMGPLVGPACVPSTLPGCASVLPVELRSFEINGCSPNMACLEWVTLTEINNRGFYVELLEQLQWHKIAEIASFSTEDRPTARREYQLAFPVEAGIHHFRLSQVDNDGKTKLLAVEAVQISGPVPVNVQPNPSTGRFTVMLPGGFRGTIVRITDHLNTNLYEHQVDTSEEMIFEVDLDRVANGVYFLIIETGSDREVHKLVIL